MPRLASESVDDPSLKFALMIRDLNLALSRHGASDLQDLGLSQAQIPVLSVIGDLPGSTGLELAEATHTTPQAVSQVLCRLVDAGMVRREALGGRAMGHHLTESGAAATREARIRFARLADALLVDLSDDEQAVLLSSLGRVLDATVRLDAHETPVQDGAEDFRRNV
ncbi:MarR family transcriptional regulator [Gordonia humi]|uniref:DNA-binding MarR family transcriptional regulator n=1 Tax=Gordonia humi TaxID=686429 RepID=A0A840FCV6_9ACTN|nr:DNA-binding MarR family transcriptional regulator [Gordonia humi]